MRTQDDKYPGFRFGLTDTRDEARERKDEKRAGREDPKHLAFVRKQRCIIAGKRSKKTGLVHRCKGRDTAHHEPAIGKKTNWHDRKTVKACGSAHTERHAIGKARFERRYGVDIEAEAARLDAMNQTSADSALADAGEKKA